MNFSYVKAAVFSFALLSIVVVSGSVAEASHSWGTYHWARTSNPFTLKLGDNVSGVWDAHMATSSLDWSVSSVLNTTIVPGLTTARRCKPTKGRVEVCASTYGKNGWLGLAQIWISGSHITKGLVKMNDTYFNTATYNNPNEKLHVMCQEIGHTLGLDHQSTDGSSQDTCMDYFSNTGANATSTRSTRPNDHDYAQLETIYAHLDEITTILSGTLRGAAAPAEAENESDWGREIKRERGDDKKRKESHYERDLGNGNKIHTFVIWAE
ncbi:MAG: hypothetical protein AAB805_01530 [Patescibacteria group bacterium]